MPEGIGILYANLVLQEGEWEKKNGAMGGVDSGGNGDERWGVEWEEEEKGRLARMRMTSSLA